MNDVGDKFQQTTKYDPQNMPRHTFTSGGPPPLYKEYPHKPKVDLGPFEPREAMPLQQALKGRRSIRNFQQEPITRDQLSYLLWASTGIQRVEAGYEFRTAPSAGALYPIETYLLVNNISGLEMGLYHYSIRTHQLEQLEQADLRRQIAAAALGQRMCSADAANTNTASGPTDTSTSMPATSPRISPSPPSASTSVAARSEPFTTTQLTNCSISMEQTKALCTSPRSESPHRTPASREASRRSRTPLPIAALHTPGPGRSKKP
jgi:nitroreductase